MTRRYRAIDVRSRDCAATLCDREAELGEKFCHFHLKHPAVNRDLVDEVIRRAEAAAMKAGKGA